MSPVAYHGAAPGKPHIQWWPLGGEWCCYLPRGNGTTRKAAFGLTPAVAYKNWLQRPPHKPWKLSNKERTK